MKIEVSNETMITISSKSQSFRSDSKHVEIRTTCSDDLIWKSLRKKFQKQSSFWRNCDDLRKRFDQFEFVKCENHDDNDFSNYFDAIKQRCKVKSNSWANMFSNTNFIEERLRARVIFEEKLQIWTSINEKVFRVRMISFCLKITFLERFSIEKNFVFEWFRFYSRLCIRRDRRWIQYSNTDNARVLESDS